MLLIAVFVVKSLKEPLFDISLSRAREEGNRVKRLRRRKS